MGKTYSVKLVARNEGLEYRDECDVYRFNLFLTEKKWVVYLPCSKGESFKLHELTKDEYNKIIPRIIKFLENRKYFWMFGAKYPVIFERESDISPQIEQSRQQASKYWTDHSKK